MTDEQTSQKILVKFSFDRYDIFGTVKWFYGYLHAKLGNLLSIGSYKQLKNWACAKKRAQKKIKWYRHAPNSETFPWNLASNGRFAKLPVFPSTFSERWDIRNKLTFQPVLLRFVFGVLFYKRTVAVTASESFDAWENISILN